MPFPSDSYSTTHTTCSLTTVSLNCDLLEDNTESSSPLELLPPYSAPRPRPSALRKYPFNELIVGYIKTTSILIYLFSLLGGKLLLANLPHCASEYLFTLLSLRGISTRMQSTRKQMRKGLQQALVKEFLPGQVTGFHKTSLTKA